MSDFASTIVQEMLASGARNTSGVTSGFNFEDGMELIVFAEVTAASGTTPTLDLAIQVSHDNTNWSALSSFTQITGTGNSINAATNYGKYVRISYTIAGASASFTFKLTAVRKY